MFRGRGRELQGARDTKPGRRPSACKGLEPPTASRDFLASQLSSHLLERAELIGYDTYCAARVVNLGSLVAVEGGRAIGPWLSAGGQCQAGIGCKRALRAGREEEGDLDSGGLGFLGGKLATVASEGGGSGGSGNGRFVCPRAQGQVTP